MALLAAVLYFIDIRAFLDALARADYRLILVASAVFLLSLVARGLAWRTLLRDQTSFQHVFFTLNEGYLLNNILPFRLGEFGRALLLSNKSSLGFWEVFSTILIERAFDLALTAGLLLSALPFILGAAWAQQAALAAGILVIAGLLALHFLARYRKQAMGVFERLAGRFPVLLRIGRERLQSFFTGLAVLTDVRRFVFALAWMSVVWLLTLLQYYLVLIAFVPQAHWWWAAFGLGVAALGVAVPSSPGYIGVVEASLVGALSLFEVNPSVALAYAITVHLLYVVLTALLGLYGLSRDGDSLRSIYHSVRRGAQSA